MHQIAFTACDMAVLGHLLTVGLIRCRERVWSTIHANSITAVCDSTRQLTRVLFKSFIANYLNYDLISVGSDITSGRHAQV